MDPLIIAGLAIVVVIGSILRLRLHPFLALILGGCLVATLSTEKVVYDQMLREQGYRVATFDLSAGRLLVERSRRPVEADALPAGSYQLFRPNLGNLRLEPCGMLSLTRAPHPDRNAGQPIAAESNSPPREADSTTPRPQIQLVSGAIQSGDWIVHQLANEAAQKEAAEPGIERLAFGFGDTCRKIGLLIAMASMIGVCLLESGAAARIVSETRRVVGDRQAPLAFAASGFVIGIPVFFDTVFYLLMPLAKALRLRTGKNYLLYILSVIVGATMAHSLVPPTPGPLLVAGELEVGMLTMIVAGTIVGLIAVAVGFLYALWANRRWTIPLRDGLFDDSATEPPGRDPAPPNSPAQRATDSRSDALPARTGGTASAGEESGFPFWLAIGPIALPVILLTAATAAEMMPVWFSDANSTGPAVERALRELLAFFGNKNMALLLAALLAIGMVIRARPARAAERLPHLLQQAIASAGTIVLITAAGGAFGEVLRQSGVAAAVERYFPESGTSGLALLLVAFAITAVVRFAQGSATVAMITAIGIVAPLASSLALPYHPVYLALAIGCGSKPFPWMNDSGFWVVCRMSGMTESETLKTYSVMLTIMGFTGLIATICGAWCLPLR